MFKYKALSILYNLCPSRKLKAKIWKYANDEFPIVKRSSWLPKLRREYRNFARPYLPDQDPNNEQNDALATVQSCHWCILLLERNKCPLQGYQSFVSLKGLLNNLTAKTRTKKKECQDCRPTLLDANSSPSSHPFLHIIRTCKAKCKGVSVTPFSCSVRSP